MPDDDGNAVDDAEFEDIARAGAEEIERQAESAQLADRLRTAAGRATQTGPSDKHAVPLGRGADEIIKSFALLGVSGFLLQGAVGVFSWATDSVWLVIAVLCSLVLTLAAVLLFTIGAWLMIVGIARIEKLLAPELSQRHKEWWAWFISILIAISIASLAALVIGGLVGT